MNRTSVCVIAGAALSIGGHAMAQSAADHERAYAAELMGDAAARTSELAQDRRFSVDVHGFFQFRYNWNQRDEPIGTDEETTLGFQMARARLNVSGNIINEDWGYFVQFGTDADEFGLFFLEDAYGTMRFEGGWQLQFGQFVLPFSREQLVGHQYQLAADRSVSNSVFTLGRSQGVQVGFAGDQLRFAGAFSDGHNSRNVDFDMTASDFALTGRLEFKWAGEWAQARDFTSFPNSDFFGMVGFAGHWESGGSTAGPFMGTTDDQDFWAVTADVSVEGSGWNVFGAAYYESIDPSGSPSMDNYGFLVQGGMFVTPQTELFGRFDAIFPDDGFEDLFALTLGVNHYFAPESHAAKFTVDFQWFFDSPDDSIVVTPNTLVGVLPDAGDNQWNIRAQFQFLF
jgi:phosphate-selective porin OprO and OprP